MKKCIILILIPILILLVACRETNNGSNIFNISRESQIIVEGDRLIIANSIVDYQQITDFMKKHSIILMYNVNANNTSILNSSALIISNVDNVRRIDILRLTSHNFEEYKGLVNAFFVENVRRTPNDFINGQVEALEINMTVIDVRLGIIESNIHLEKIESNLFFISKQNNFIPGRVLAKTGVGSFHNRYSHFANSIICVTAINNYDQNHCNGDIVVHEAFPNNTFAGIIVSPFTNQVLGNSRSTGFYTIDDQQLIAYNDNDELEGSRIINISNPYLPNQRRSSLAFAPLATHQQSLNSGYLFEVSPRTVGIMLHLELSYSLTNGRWFIFNRVHQFGTEINVNIDLDILL